MTPFDHTPPHPSGLCLYIEESSCVCGHKWTHSHTVLTASGRFYGVPPSAEQQRTLKLERIHPLKRTYTSCFRCVPADLLTGFAKPTPSPVPISSPQRSIVDLDGDIFG